MIAALNNENIEHNVKLTLSYDGSSYFGFQSQVHKNTIEDQLRHAVGIILKLKDEEVKLTTAGRTDTGVHAYAQVVNFMTNNRMLETNWILALNSLLPSDIRIANCEFVDDKFSARRSAIYREYVYNIDNNMYVNALNNRYCTHYYKSKLDEKKLNEYCKYLIGEHDFTSFCASGDTNKTKTRCIFDAHFQMIRDNKYEFTIIGNAFLQHMVRIIVGTIIDLYSQNAPAHTIQNILEQKDRNKAGQTFPSKGLVLKKIYYTDEHNFLQKKWK